MENNNSKPNGTNKYKLFSQIVKEFYNEELEKIDSNIDSKINNIGTIKLVPKLTYDKYSREMKIEFKIGNKKLYKIRTLSEFYKNMLNHNVATYGNKLTFIHSREMFEDGSKELLDFVMKYAEAIWFANSAINSNYRYYGKALNDSYIIISNSALDELFDILKGQKIEFQRDLTKGELELIDGNPEMEFDLNETENQGDGFLESVGFDDSDFLDLFENIIKLPFKLIKDFNEEVSNENKSVFDMFHHNGNEQKINELQKDLKEIKQNLK